MLAVSQSCLDDLGWHHVLDAVADHCASDLARAALRTEPQLLPTVDAVRHRLALVAELTRLVDKDAALPLAPLHDIEDAVARCERGGYADAETLVDIGRTATTLGRLRRHARHHAEHAPQLADATAALPDLGPLGRQILATFDEAGRIRDDASPELHQARRRSAKLHQALKARLDTWLQHEDVQPFLQEDYYTQRDDRFVVPVQASFQARVPGIIHGTSQTGQTVFVEPEAFITANNELKLAEAAVEQEERRVLAERARWVAQEAEELRAALLVAVDLDGAQARARFGGRWECAVPLVADDGDMLLRQARNPLLLFKGTPVVANDIRLDEAHSFVVITGPNTGGKTVTLNTTGLLVLMACSALPVPAADGTRVVVPTAVHALVGDPQDIQKDLSTFSGHLAALKHVMEGADPGTLVLLDELIVGTEPERGAALAIACLEALAERGARGLVTTHYQQLKTLPYRDDRFANANVGIDVASGQPTYALHMGEPGSSNPFVIAERLGFFPAVLERARAISTGDAGLAEAVAALESARAEADRARREAEAERARAEVVRARLEREERRIAADVRAEVTRLRDAALEETARALEHVRSRVRELQDERDPRRVEALRKEIADVKEQLEACRGAEPAEAPSPAPTGPADGGDLDGQPAVGDGVWVRPLNRQGEVLEVGGSQVVVGVGGLRMTLSVDKLGRLAGVMPPRPAPPRPTRPRARVSDTRRDAEELTPHPRSDRNSIDLRGVRRDEVADQLERFLDRLYVSNAATGWVIHGHGTGAVRDEVRRVVRSSSYIEAWRGGRRHEGGDGVTLVWPQRT